MLIKKYSISNFKPSTLTTDIWRIHTCKDNTQATFNCAFIKLKPQKESFAHKHHDAETFTIIQGEGVVNCDDAEQKVFPGDIIHFKPFSRHSIKNISNSTELIYQTIWWEPKLEYINEVKKETLQRTTLIFSALPTPNGDLHLGHLAGPYLSADIFYRYNIRNNKSTRHYMGVDRNQSYVAYLAQKLKVTTETISLRYYKKIKETLKISGIHAIHYDEKEQFILGTAHLFNDLFNKGFIFKKRVKTACCKQCDAFQHEAFLLGLCKVCKFEMTGSICENCFAYTGEENLIQPYCNVCQNPINLVDKERFVFKLSHFKEKLTHFYCKTSMPEFAKVFCYDHISTLEDVPVSHCGKWGIKIFIDDKSELVPVYSVLEIAARYISLIKDCGSNKSTQIIQCLGVDNMFNRLILIPALVIACDNHIKLPDINVINYFYLLEGEKFSTSRNHFIHINQLLRNYSLDAVRYYIALTRPENNETEFRYDDFSKIVEEHLINRWDIYIKKLSSIKDLISEKECNPGVWNDTQTIFFEYLKDIQKNANSNYQSSKFSTKNICLIFSNLIDEVASFIVSQTPVFKNTLFESEQRTAVYLITIATKLSAYLIEPIMPTFSKKIFIACGSIEMVSLDNLFDFLPQSINVEQLDYHWKITTCSKTSAA